MSLKTRILKTLAKRPVTVRGLAKKLHEKQSTVRGRVSELYSEYKISKYDGGTVGLSCDKDCDICYPELQ